MDKNLNENSVVGLTSNFMTSVAVIVVSFVALMLIFKLFNYMSANLTNNNNKISTEEILPSKKNINIPIIKKEEEDVHIIPAEQILKPVVVSSPIIKEEIPAVKEEIPVVKEMTKQMYNKFEEIILPSSIGSPNGYIGRDFVCYRKKIGDQDFVSKRGGCIACQVNNKNIDKAGNTNTNVVSTCVYSDKLDPSDPSVWTKQMCIDQCAKITDIN